MEEAACQLHALPSRHQWRGFSEQLMKRLPSRDRHAADPLIAGADRRLFHAPPNPPIAARPGRAGSPFG
ncbi:hypothetical protein A8E98_21355 [Burkholderia cenocepacia]|nr:hypothetical protein A8E98_21355 [Burkholderia cenocepacia]